LYRAQFHFREDQELSESEKRFKRAVARLEKAAKADGPAAGKASDKLLEQATAKSAALEAQNDTLQKGLKSLKADYETLNTAFSKIKKQIEAAADKASDSGAVGAELEKIKQAYSAQLAENELLTAEAKGVSASKEKLRASLDRAIERVEAIAATAAN
jgi:chromosome segregation ATPase